MYTYDRLTIPDDKYIRLDVLTGPGLRCVAAMHTGAPRLDAASALLELLRYVHHAGQAHTRQQPKHVMSDEKAAASSTQRTKERKCVTRIQGDRKVDPPTL